MGDLTQGEPALHSLSLTSFQDTNTSSQVCQILPHVSDKFNQLIVPLPSKPTTPVNVITLEQELTGYPDMNMVDYLLSGFKQGFRIGYEGLDFPLITKNLPSATDNPEQVTAAIIKELERSHTAGPFTQPPFENFRCSPLGAVPKKDGTHRLIIDLSSPSGLSINDFISKEDYSVTFSKFDDVVSMVKSLGKSALMAKLDIKHAFRLCPVSPIDWHLLGTHWEGFYFIELRLPFGLRSSVFIFNSFADALEWILRNKYYLKVLSHYLDDFFTAGPADSPQCQSNLIIIQQVFDKLGVPLAPEKLEGPTTVLTYLGIEIDSDDQVIRLPDDKYSDLQSQLTQWIGKKKCTKRELLSLIGKLSFAAKVVRSGRLFLRRLIDLSTTARKLHHHINLNAEARKDIQWWLDFLPTWNGISVFPDDIWTPASELLIFTDASSKIGYGAYCKRDWFCGAWPPHLQGQSIQWKELFTIYLSCAVWGHNWPSRKLISNTDNSTNVAIWSAQSSKSKDLMDLARKIFLISATHNFLVQFQNIPGSNNPIADALSRLQMQKFRELAPDAKPNPTPIPEHLFQL